MNHLKQFDVWNVQKKNIHVSNTRDFYIKPREIWFTKMGINIGFEENGKKEFTRPVLVIKKVGNLFFTVALTTKGKVHNKFYHVLENVMFNDLDFQGTSTVILSQARVMDKKRFEEKIGIVSENEFEDIKQKLKALLL